MLYSQRTATVDWIKLQRCTTYHKQSNMAA